MKKLIILLLSVVLLTLSLNVYIGASDDALTRGEALELILSACDAYFPDITENEIIKGYPDGEKRLSENVTRVELTVMLSRAFPKLPELSPENKRNGIFDNTFSDVPDWAAENVKTLNLAGILNENSEDALVSGGKVSKIELTTILARIYAYFATEKKDDFFAAVNSEFLNSVTDFPAGYAGYGAANLLVDENTKKLSGIVDDCISGKLSDNPQAVKVKNFYNSYLNTEQRTKDGLGDLKPYIDEITSAKSISELFDINYRLDMKYGLGLLNGFSVMADFKDSSINSLYMSGLSGILTADMYAVANENMLLAYSDMLNKFLVFCGDSEENAKKNAESYIELEKVLIQNAMSSTDSAVISNIYNPTSPADICDYFTGFDYSAVLNKYGFDKLSTIVVTDPKLVKKCGELLTEDNLSAIKAYMKIKTVYSLSSVLPDEIYRATEKLSGSLYGIESTVALSDLALMLTQNVVSVPIEKLYVEKYFPEAAKKDVEGIVTDIISVYKEKLEKNTWLSEETRKKAIFKLDNMKVKIGFPEVWDDPCENVEITEESLINNVLNIFSENSKDSYEKIGKEVDKNEWKMTVFTVNAYNDIFSNTIVFPAGILQEPFYSIDYPREANLAGIGSIIAHEISHAFDNNGAKLDENGNTADWWTPEDYKAFDERCSSVVKFYDKVEIVNGIMNNGLLTVSENVADLGGLSCALEIAKKDENADLKLFFEAYAKAWSSAATRQAVYMASTSDVHSNHKLRVNCVLKNIDDFYTVFDIDENDGMYVPKEERVRVW